MDMLLLGTRLALALVFAVASFSKLADRPGSIKALVDFGLPLRFAKPMALVVTLDQHAAHKDKRGHGLVFQ